MSCSRLLRTRRREIERGLLFEDVLTNLTEDELARLERRESLGELHFGPAVPLLRRIRGWLELLDQQDPLDIYPTLQSESGVHAQQVVAIVQAIKAFSLSLDNAATTHEQLLAQAKAEHDWFVQTVRPNIRPMEADLAGLQRETRNSVKQAKAASAEVQTILDRLRGEAGAVGAGQLSSYYREQAKAHDRQSYIFLALGGASLVVTVLLTWYFLVANPLAITLSGESAWLEFLRGVIPRLFVIGIGAYVVSFGARNYRVNKHQQIVNEQRRNALDTYALFASALGDPSTREIALAELLRAVFGAADTGYLSGGHERTVLETPIIGSILGRNLPG